MEEFVSTNNILVSPETAYTKSVVVNGDDLPTDKDGHKYLLAGTLLTADKDLMLNSDAVATKTDDTSNAQGILLNDARLDKGQKLQAVVTEGFINRNQMTDEIKKFYTDDVINKLKTVLPHIKFIDNK